MIPAFGFGEVLPPFVGQDVTGSGQLPRSPYLASTRELVEAFCTSPERAAILKGLLSFREALRADGFTEGFQWIDGSFVENCESVKGRPPRDVDVVSLLRRPDAHKEQDAWGQFVQDRLNTLFDPEWAKETYSCDSYFVDLDSEPESVAQIAAYWVGLFSHQRDTFRWKGMVQVPIQQDDESARQLIEEREGGW